jgi:hypothetical protein
VYKNKNTYNINPTITIHNDRYAPQEKEKDRKDKYNKQPCTLKRANNKKVQAR